MKYLEEVISILRKGRAFGSRTLDDGVELIGHVPHVAPEAWFHQIFPALDEEGVKAIEAGIGRNLPPVLVDFYHHMNGLKIFSGSLTIDGLRQNYKRDLEPNRQPFNIVTPNVHERPCDAKESFIFIGGYDYDGSNLYIDVESGITCRSAQYRALEVLNWWPSFENMLVSEVHRLEGMFDEKGLEIDPEQPTTPEVMPADAVGRN